MAASAGNLMDVICLAIRAALHDLKIPKTKEIGYQIQKAALPTIDGMEVDVSGQKASDSPNAGIKGLLQSRRPLASGSREGGGGKAINFELQDTDGNMGDRLIDRDSIPIVITINVVRTFFYTFVNWVSESFGV